MRTAGAHVPILLAFLISWVATAPCNGQALMTTKLKPETLEFFQSYAKRGQTIHEQRIKGQKPFLWIDETPGHRSRVDKGEILIRDNAGQPVEIPGGIVHDWIGAMLVPGGSLKETVKLLRDYDRHKDIYPEVVDSRILSNNDDHLKTYLRLVKKKVLTVVLNTEHEVQFEEIDDRRWSIYSRSTRIAEVKDAGKPGETEMPPGEDSGFLWRLNAFWRLEETDNGLYVELATISLSRDLPTGMAWLIKPLITQVPRESLQSTLEATRQALQP